MKVIIAADHGGFELREALLGHLKDSGYEIEDFGNKKYDPEDDYPDFVIPATEKLVGEQDTLGIIIGRSGNGEAIAANKITGARAAVCLSENMAQMAREHNDANILSLGADYITTEEAFRITDRFLKTPFSNEERHVRRIKKLSNI